jgi:hypothetical protein
LRRRHVAAGASRADCGPRVPKLGFVAPCSGSGVLEWLCCRPASGARAVGGPARRVGLPPATWGPVIAGTGTGGGSVGTSHPSDSSPRHFPWSGSEYLSTSEVLDVGRFCGVDRLQITCHRRSENPSAVTAKTPKNGLEITYGGYARDCRRMVDHALRSAPRAGGQNHAPGAETTDALVSPGTSLIESFA